MLRHGSRRPRNGEQGQTLILALVFIVFFALVASAILRFGDVTGLQHVHTEATAANDSVAEGGAAYAAADAASGVTPTCATGDTGQLRMEDSAGNPGDFVGYTVNTCNPNGAPSTGGTGTNCLLCILNQASPTASVLYTHCAQCGRAPALTTYGGNDYVNGTIASGTSLTSYSCSAAPCTTDARIDVLYPNTAAGCICNPAPPITSVTFPYAPAIKDPLKGLLAPSSVATEPSICTPAPCTPATLCHKFKGGRYNAPGTTGCTLTLQNNTFEVSPGLWASLTINGSPSTSVTMTTGTYVFTNQLLVSGNGPIDGSSGVTLYLACPSYPSPCPTTGATGGSLQLGGQGSVNITAPGAPAQYAGVAILADPHLLDPGGASSCASSGTSCLYSVPGVGAVVTVAGTVDTRSGGTSILGNGGDTISLGRLITNSLYISVSGSAGSGLSLTAPPNGASTSTCDVFEDGVYGAAIAPLSPPSAVVQSACGSGTTSGIVDFNYVP